ncbi:MAG TPA: hypothetical protein DEG43_14070 [Acidimicrobiaceae bacterium]|nr:hypothetical protein [Acidimicrobiaceae bacterium]
MTRSVWNSMSRPTHSSIQRWQVRSLRRNIFSLPRRKKHKPSERGAAAVELAFAIIPIMMVLTALVDFGTVFDMSIDARSNVRNASWNSARAILGSTTGCNLTGPPGDAATQRVMCMAKRNSGVPEANIRVMVRFVDFNNVSNPATHTVGNGLMVCTMTKMTSTTGFWAPLLNNRVLKMRMETPITYVGLTPIVGGSETAFSGQSWSFCDPTQGM